MTIAISSLPPFCTPIELLLFEPRTDDIKQFFRNGDFERKIYTNIRLDQSEMRKCAELRRLQEQSKAPLGPCMESRLLRYLSHTRGNCAKALEHLLVTQQWRREFFQPPIRDTSMERILNSGLAYYCGRDCGMRPLLIVRAKVALQNELWTEAEFTKYFAFCLEFALRYLFIPGKVETLIVLLDMEGVGWNFPRERLKAIANLLAKHYAGRLYQMLVVNAAAMISGVWSLVKHFFSDRQQAKTVFIKKACLVQKDRFALHQLETQYGGSVPRLTTFYPFHFYPGPFTANWDHGPDPDAIPDAHRAVCRATTIGVCAETGIGVRPLKWSKRGMDILQKAGLLRSDFTDSESDSASEFPIPDGGTDGARQHVFTNSPRVLVDEATGSRKEERRRASSPRGSKVRVICERQTKLRISEKETDGVLRKESAQNSIVLEGIPEPCSPLLDNDEEISEELPQRTNDEEISDEEASQRHREKLLTPEKLVEVHLVDEDVSPISEIKITPEQSRAAIMRVRQHSFAVERKERENRQWNFCWVCSPCDTYKDEIILA